MNVWFAGKGWEGGLNKLQGTEKGLVRGRRAITLTLSLAFTFLSLLFFSLSLLSPLSVSLSLFSFSSFPLYLSFFSFLLSYNSFSFIVSLSYTTLSVFLSMLLFCCKTKYLSMKLFSTWSVSFRSLIVWLVELGESPTHSLCIGKRRKKRKGVHYWRGLSFSPLPIPFALWIINKLCLSVLLFCVVDRHWNWNKKINWRANWVSINKQMNEWMTYNDLFNSYDRLFLLSYYLFSNK